MAPASGVAAIGAGSVLAAGNEVGEVAGSVEMGCGITWAAVRAQRDAVASVRIAAARAVRGFEQGLEVMGCVSAKLGTGCWAGR